MLKLSDSALCADARAITSRPQPCGKQAAEAFMTDCLLLVFFMAYALLTHFPVAETAGSVLTRCAGQNTHPTFGPVWRQNNWQPNQEARQHIPAPHSLCILVS